MCFRPSVLFPAIFSTFGLTAFYSELWKERVPVWLGVTILTLPVGLIVIVQMGDLAVFDWLPWCWGNNNAQKKL